MTWDTSGFDLDAYLGRIGLSRPPSPDLDALGRWQRAHISSISFDNAGVVLGEGIATDLPTVQAKLVGGGRGGYCHEHVVLAGAALDTLGFEATRILARVRPDATDGPPTHAALLVDVGGSRWLCDVGFGAAPLEPVELRPGEQAGAGGWPSQLEPRGGGTWRMLGWLDGEWHALHEFVDRPVTPEDIAASNVITSTSRHSPFVGQTVSMRSTPEARTALIGVRERVTTPDGATTETELPADEALATFARAAGIAPLDPEQEALLRAQLG